MHTYSLIDGVVYNGVLVKEICIKSLNPDESNEISILADKQYAALKSKDSFCVVNERHGDSIKGLIYLNEHAAASIAEIGGKPVTLTFFDVCEMKMTAQDWQVILSASMAVEEYHCLDDGVMQA